MAAANSDRFAAASLPSNSSKTPEKTTPRTFILKSSPAQSNTSGHSAEHSGPTFQPVPMPDLFEDLSLLDLIDFRTMRDYGNYSNNVAEPGSSEKARNYEERDSRDQSIKPSEKEPSQHVLSTSKTSSKRVAASLPGDSSLASRKQSSIMLRSGDPDLEQKQLLERDREDASNLSSAVPPSLSSEVKSMVKKFADSDEMKFAELEAKKFAEAAAMMLSESEAMRPFSTTHFSTKSISTTSSNPSRSSLRQIATSCSSLPEDNLSETHMNLAGSISAASTSSTGRRSWATSCFSSSPIPKDHEFTFTNGKDLKGQSFPYIPAPTNPLKSGWRILCLDAGGVRGLSMLYMVSELMSSIQSRLRLPRAPLPCEIFEMICGVGTGGIIALLLGRMRLDTSSAIVAYLEIVKKVFGQSKRVISAFTRAARFNARKLEEVVRDVVTQISGDPQLPLADGETHTRCRSLIIAMRPSESKGERSSFRKLRSYSYEMMAADSCSVALAARATSAAPSVIKPTALDDEHGRIHPVTADSSIYNPSWEALAEAEALFKHRNIDCLVSLGVGKGSASSSGSIARACAEMSLSCERASRKVELKSCREGWSGKYIRLFVKGLKNGENAEEWENPEAVKAATEAYLRTEEKEKFNKQVENLSNSWQSAYDDDCLKGLVKVGSSKMITTPRTAIFPASSQKLSLEMLRRSVSVDQVDDQDQYQAKFVDKFQSLRKHTVSQASTIMGRVRSRASSTRLDAELSGYISSVKLELPEFDFEGA